MFGSKRLGKACYGFAAEFVEQHLDDLVTCPDIAGNFLFGQRRGGTIVCAVHDVPELVQERESN